MTDKTYNGWTNYESWVVNLWMDNNEGSQGYYAEEATRCWEEAERGEMRAYASQTRTECATSLLADVLKAEFEEANPIKGASVWSDLMSAALGAVNWYEIAEHVIEAQEFETEAA